MTDLTRESLAAERVMSPARLYDALWLLKQSRFGDDDDFPTLPEVRTAILATLPSPAPQLAAIHGAAQPAPDPEAIRLLERLVETHAVYLDALNGIGHPDEPHNSDFAELGISLRTADECSACAGAQYGSESDMDAAFDEARSFLSKSEAREEPK